MTLRAFSRTMEFVFVKGKAAFSAFRRGDNQTILGMLEAFHQVLDIISHLTRRHLHMACDLGNPEGII